jgi:alkanesulfonate monooxygenase SsuD/methylene tetrahydromethanopterin reductase-like flavin-dependent oxidoreductase (luciferase family)
VRFHFAEAMTNIDYYIPLAKAAEANGYAGMLIPDSICYPEHSDTKYSYNSDGSREFLENKPFLESFVMAAALGAVTEKLELTTNVVKLPIRPPVYSAKLASSIAALTNDRFNFGVGLSVWPEDYEIMGLPYEKRGKRIDECIEIVKGLCAGGYFEFHGEFYDVRSIKLNPVPKKPLPILIGGHSDAAFKRAAKHDGFLVAGGGPDVVRPIAQAVRRYREELGTLDKPFRFFAPFMPDLTPELLGEYAELGVTDYIIGFREPYKNELDSQPLQEKLDNLKAFADAVISKF